MTTNDISRHPKITIDCVIQIYHLNYLFINFPRFFNSPPTPYFVSVIFPRFFNSSTTPPYIPLCQDDKGLWCTTGWPKCMWKTSRWVKLGMFHHPAWAVASYSSGPAAARTVGTKSTGGFSRPDGSPCNRMWSWGQWCHNDPIITALTFEGDDPLSADEGEVVAEVSLLHDFVLILFGDVVRYILRHSVLYLEVELRFFFEEIKTFGGLLDHVWLLWLLWSYILRMLMNTDHALQRYLCAMLEVLATDVL